MSSERNLFRISAGMRIPVQDITIVNNHPINFERGIWPKSHPRAASFLTKIHGKKSSSVFVFRRISFCSHSEYHRLGLTCFGWCDGLALL